MPSFFQSAAALAMVGAAFANPVDKRYTPDQCAAAVTGKAALGDDSLRKEHCSSFFKTIVTPAAVTVTTTITDKPKPSGWNQWQKKDVTVCPNEVPNYASACDDKGYRSACSAWGVSYDTTFTIPATTTTKSVYVYGGSSCPAGATATVLSTKTETSTVAGSTTTVAGSTATTTVAGSTATTTTTVVVGGGIGGKNGTTTVTTTVAGSTTTVGGSTVTVAGSTTTVAGSTTTVSVAGSTTTVTAPGSTVTIGGSGINGTATVTVTKDPITVTVTAPAGNSTTPAPGTSSTTTTGASSSTTTSASSVPVPSTCLTTAKAKEFTDAFKNLLEYTNKGSAATGNGPYNSNISAQYLAEDFQDYSDSINFMAHFPLGGVTFPSRQVFDQQQGDGQDPMRILSESTYFGCNTITWRWTALTSSYATVTGINTMILNDDLTQIKINYAEFNSGAWIQSFAGIPGNPYQINCETPSSSANSQNATTSTGSSSNGTASTGGTTRRFRN